MRMDYYCVILIYTFVDNDELDSEFLRLIKNEFKDCIQINESTYVINDIDYNGVAEKIKVLYDNATKQYPSKGNDYVSILYAAMLANINNKDKYDRIVEQHIIGTSFNA